jgi:hypothetical protein
MSLMRPIARGADEEGTHGLEGMRSGGNRARQGVGRAGDQGEPGASGRYHTGFRLTPDVVELSGKHTMFGG